MSKQVTAKCGNGRCRGRSPSKLQVRARSSVVSTLATAAIAILPKCPMCALAYSTAITMCSGQVYIHSVDWTSYISLGLGAFTLLVVLWNYRGCRTLVAAGCIAIATAVVAWVELRSGKVGHYYMACGLLLFGVWLNGSFLHFFRKWVSFFKRRIELLMPAYADG